MTGRIKLLFAKLTLLVSLLALGITSYTYAQSYSLSKAFQLGTLVAMGVFAAAALFFYLLSFLLSPLLSKLQERPEPSYVEEKKPYVLPKEERIIRHNSKEEYAEHNTKERESVYEARQMLTELEQERGAFAEILILLPEKLAFLMAKESIEALFRGRIIDEEIETGEILGRAGWGSSAQEIKISIKPVTDHSSSVTIISKSNSSKRSEKKELASIKKISDFLRKKEKSLIQ